MSGPHNRVQLSESNRDLKQDQLTELTAQTLCIAPKLTVKHDNVEPETKTIRLQPSLEVI